MMTIGGKPIYATRWQVLFLPLGLLFFAIGLALKIAAYLLYLSPKARAAVDDVGERLFEEADGILD